MTVVQSIINMCVKKVSSFRCPTQHNWSAFLHKLLIFNNINLIQLYNFKLSIFPHVFENVVSFIYYSKCPYHRCLLIKKTKFPEIHNNNQLKVFSK